MTPGQFRLGFLALSDAAPLIVADRLGLFAAQGLDVVLCREASWATLRDKLTAGLLDGAHMLAALALAVRLGLSGEACPLIAPMGLNRNGAAVTLAAGLAERLGLQLGGASSAPLREEAARRAQAGERPLTLGVVFAISEHAHLLRDWLAAGGLDPDRDVRLRVAAPTAMVEALRAGELDGFCVGAPWNAVAEAAGVGRIVLHGSEVHASAPDKAFVVREDWAGRNGEAIAAIIAALQAAGRWADEPANRPDLLRLLAASDAVGASEAVLARAFDLPSAERLSFSEPATARPDAAKARFLLDQLQRWHGAGPLASADGFQRPDLYDAAGDMAVERRPFKR